MSLNPPGPMTPHEAFSWARGALAAIDADSAALDAKLFILHAWGAQANSVHLLPDVPGSNVQISELFYLIRRRLSHEPTAYILGHKEFWSLEFTVSPAVLIPRPDSETLVRHALDLLPERDHPYTVLDLGTGSGCLLLSFLHERPHARGLGIDASSDALTVAQKNADKLGLATRADFAPGDWAEGLTGSFDLILCNPPYVAETDRNGLARDVRDFEPHGALFGGPDGMAAYSRIIPQLRARLAPGGCAILEAGFGQAAGIARLLIAQGLEAVEFREDWGGVVRSVAARR